jgi:cell division transport system ATP-binding protein
MIRFAGVTKVYPRRGAALSNISFHLRKGEFAFLTGHSGAGKSTLLRLIHMVDRPTEGEVDVGGFSSRSTPEKDVWKLRRKVGCVFQDFRLLPGRSALENVAFALEVTGLPRRETIPRAQRLLAQVGLTPRADAPVEELSGGEQQRVAIARALVNDPLLLLADEPTGNLDERASRSILQLFRDLHAVGLSILMATHDLQTVRHFSGLRVLELDQGALVYDSHPAGSPAGMPGMDPTPMNQEG